MSLDDECIVDHLQLLTAADTARAQSPNRTPPAVHPTPHTSPLRPQLPDPLTALEAPQTSSAFMNRIRSGEIVNDLGEIDIEVESARCRCYPVRFDQILREDNWRDAYRILCTVNTELSRIRAILDQWADLLHGLITRQDTAAFNFDLYVPCRYVASQIFELVHWLAELDPVIDALAMRYNTHMEAKYGVVRVFGMGLGGMRASCGGI